MSSRAFQVISMSDAMQQLPPSLVVASSGCEALVLLTLVTCLSLTAHNDNNLGCIDSGKVEG